MAVVMGLPLWRLTSVALPAVAAPQPATASEPLVVGMETSVSAAAAAAALRVLITPVRISWKPIAGTTTGMPTDSRGLAGWRQSVVAIPDLPHHPDDVVAMVTVVPVAARILWTMEA